MATTEPPVQLHTPTARPPERARLWFVPGVAIAVALVLTIATTVTGPLFTFNGRAEAWASITVAIVLQAIPFLVFGVVISGIISAFLPESFVRRVIPRDPFIAVPVAAASGAVLPGCECASVPVSQSLVRRGMPTAAALAFLLASPAINPVVLISTAVAFQGNTMMMIARLVASLVAAILMGWLWITFGSDLSSVDKHDHEGSSVSKWELFRQSAMHDLLNAGGFLALGAMTAALIKVLVPVAWFTTMNRYHILSCLLMAALAILLSLCSEADAFIAASFTQVSPTAQLVFLVVGPMIDLKLMAMQYGAWGRRFVTMFAPMTLVVAVLVAMATGGVLFGKL